MYDDPNAALIEMRRRVNAVRRAIQGDEPLALRASELVDQVIALDTWLSSGGFPPEAWREGPDAPVETPDHECIYCGEPIEYRDGEWMQKYGNDPQCDESRSRNGNHLPRKKEN